MALTHAVHIRKTLVPGLTFALLAGLLPLAAPHPAAAAAAEPASPGTAPDQATALRLARESGDRVEVLPERTEYSQVFAEPSGRLTYESGVVPERVQHADGSWSDVDTTLVRSGDGLRPRVSTADLRFSAGGSGPLVTMTEAGQRLSLSWPGGELPEPQVSGDTATYPEVLPGVDLAVRATEDGFSHVLKVKTAEAAKNPELREITFAVGGDATLRRTTGGALQAVAGDTLIASAPAPAMWDSPKPATAAAKQKAARAAVESSSAAAPADLATVAPVATGIEGGDLVLRPDAKLLAANAAYPVFIDPAWSKGKTRWAYSTNNNTNNTDVSRARVGMDPDGRIYRSYFEFPTAELKGRHVESAYVQMKVDHSYSCDNTWTHMFSASPISKTPRNPWKSSSPFLKHLSSAESHANEGAGCSDSPQPDMTVNFTGSAVTSLLGSVADKGASTVTIAFSAGNEDQGYESDKTRWKKFFPNDAKLIADVDAIPGKPYSVQVAGIACRSTTISIGITNPWFSAVMPDADGSQALKSTWEWFRVQDSGWTKLPSPVTSGTPANTRDASERVTEGVNGGLYALRVRGTDPAPYAISGDWSDYCYFRIDTADPPVTAVMLSAPSGPGKPGTFRIQSTATDVTKFRYGWNEAVLNEVTAGTISGVTGKAAVVTLTAPRYGENVLHLQAIDSTLNEGDGSLTFSVARPSPAIARWGLETYPGIEAGSELKDAQPALPAAPASFQRADASLETPVNVTWTDKQRLVGGSQATFNNNGVLTTPTAVVDTTKSFAVAAWVRLDDVTGYRTIASQDGDHVANFQLQYRSDDRNGDGVADKSFCFGMRAADTDSNTAGPSACAVNTAEKGRWTHVAGVFDAAEKKVRVWVDGTLRSEATASTPWSSTGKFRIGNRRITSTAWTDGLIGAVADVQVFDRTIVEQDFVGMRASDPGSGGVNEPGILEPIEIGRYDFSAAVPCYDPTIADTCSAPDGAAWSRELRLTQGADIASGARGNYLDLDDRQLLYDDPSDVFYGKVTREYGSTRKNTAAAGQPATWQDAPVLRSDQSFSVSMWVHVDSLATTMTALAPTGVEQAPFYLQTRDSTIDGVTAKRFEVMTVSADSDLGETYGHVIAPTALDVDDEGSFTHLVMVYDAGRKQIRLYVNGKWAVNGSWTTAWQANGPLVVGSGIWSADNTSPAMVSPWRGGIDDIRLYQGALTSARIENLYDEQAA
ncbi:LamG domain-containing protein [Actinoplanes sp. RD1]|uniref:LamG domain-containing protein n=1 Tax=Actinoplanes sp. RD1 TaxID=3064538 RepID=UPI002740C118|nr:LamG domain-containing protein [Actinoplanes sp. RD1]